VKTVVPAALSALLLLACARGPRTAPALAPIAAPEPAARTAGTASPSPRIDLALAGREGRILRAAPASPRHARTGEMPKGAPFRWAGAGARLERRGVPSHPRARLALDARDGGGNVTEFLVDTGSSSSALAVTAPAARSALIWPEGDRTSMRATTVWHALLPALDIGGLRGTDAPILLHERPGNRVMGGNQIGMTLLSGLSLEHEATGDAWRLVPGGGAARAGGRASMSAPGLPVVRLVNERGERAWALIDTGTWVSLSEAGTRDARWRLEGAEGETLLSFAPSATAPWTGLEAGPHHVTLWIGLDALEGHTWTMDFTTGVWSFADAKGR
jgi:hypothetical protein